MKSWAAASVATLGLITAVYGGPAETAIVAAMKLSEQPNYSWVASVVDDARSYDIVGKTVKGGYTLATMPMIASVRRRLGRSVTDTQIETIFKGNVDCVILTDQGWRKPTELSSPATPDSESDTGVSPGTQGGARRPPGMGGPGGNRRRGAKNRPGDSEPSAYSNLQLALSRPHEELGVIVASNTEWRVEGDTVTGSLTETGAMLLLVRDGQEEISPVRASATFKLWIQNGAVIKYEVKAEGVLSVSGSFGKREIQVHQTTTTVVKDIGTTRFDVPEEARRKLGGG